MMLAKLMIACAVTYCCMAAVDDDDTYHLIFSDDFNSFNTSIWTAKTGIHIPEEAEFYQPSQVSVRDGNLVLTAIEADSPQPGCTNAPTGKCEYLSGWVDSMTKFAFRNGRIEVNAKLPFGQGLWPAIWLMPEPKLGASCWPMGGEIDIMENLGQDMSKVHAALHWSHDTSGGPCGNGEGNAGDWFPPTSKPLYNESMHLYWLEWNSTALWYGVDDMAPQVISDPAASFVQRGFYIILNNAVGGPWGGYPNTSTTFPQEFIIDSVKVYQRKSEPLSQNWFFDKSQHDDAGLLPRGRQQPLA